MKPKIISFYTVQYRDCARALEKTINNFKWDYYFEEKESLDAWEKNCSLKAQFCLDCMNKFKEPLIWIDADGLLLKSLNLFQSVGCDVALYRWPFLESYYRKGKYPWRNFLVNTGWQFRTTVLYFNYNKRVLNFLENWTSECKQKPDVWDQVSYQRVWYESSLKTYWLSEDYAILRPCKPGYCPDSQVVYFPEDVIHPKSSLKKIHKKNAKDLIKFI